MTTTTHVAAVNAKNTRQILWIVPVASHTEARWLLGQHLHNVRYIRITGAHDEAAARHQAFLKARAGQFA